VQLAIVTSPDLLNPDEGDMLLEAGTAVVVDDLAREVDQGLRVAFHFFKGEWFLDLREGVPYFDQIFVKAPKDSVIRAVFTRVIRLVPGVAAVESLTYDVDAQTRALSLSFVCRLTDGQTFTSADYAPYLVEAA
jgi:hypothetical protein